VDPASQIESVLLSVEDFLLALERRSWPAFEACFDASATVYLADVPEEPEDVLPWLAVREGWKRVFAADPSQRSRIDAVRRRPRVRLRGDAAIVSFPGDAGDRAIVMGRSADKWLIRDLHLNRLPLKAEAAGSEAATQDTAAVNAGPKVTQMPAWFVPVLVFSLVAIAFLGTMIDRRSAVQITTAVLAVFLGAVTILRSEFGDWFHGATRGDNAPLTGSGALVLAVGAAFLVT
jgi:hypothetical protein